MNILVINGSPKGEYSTTLQTMLYLQKRYPAHSFSFLHVGTKIKALEKDFSPAAEAVRGAELLIFAYPVYTFLAPSQLHRFIALLKRAGPDLSQKYCTQFSTSKHFYDVTAHGYIRENALDCGMSYLRGLSADMEDLLSEKGRTEAESWFELLMFSIDKGYFEKIIPEKHPPAHCQVNPAPQAEKKPGTVALVADLAPEDTQLAAMVDRFRAVLPYETRLVNLHDFPFKGGCLSCFRCAKDGTCIYKDGFSELLRDKIQTCDAIVLAFSVTDHSMGTVFKTYDDRQFCNGHRTVTMGKPFGYLISGDYSREENLRLVINGRAQVGGNFLAGTASDEFEPDAEIDRLAVTLDYAIENRLTQPSDFLGVGGMKIFRDLIWKMQGVMRADHKFYKKHKQYDFPQKKRGTMLAMYAAGWAMNSPKIRRKLGSKLDDGMLSSYKKVLEQTKEKC